MTDEPLNTANKCCCLWSMGCLGKGPDSIRRSEYLISLPVIWGRLESEFSKLDENGDRTVTPVELQAAWVKAAESATGEHLSNSDKDLIAGEVKRVVDEMDADGDGLVSFDEFAHFVLLRASNSNLAKNFHIIVKWWVQRTSGLLSALFTNFQAHKDETGMVPAEAIDGILNKMASEANCPFNSIWAHGGLEMIKEHVKEYCGPTKPTPMAFRLDSFCETDLLSYLHPWPTHVDYGSFCMLLLGRKPFAVNLLMYDISNKSTKTFAPLLFGQTIEGVWHSSLLVFEKEWWYGGALFRSKPYSTPFGRPVRTVRLGMTFFTDQELHGFAAERLTEKFNEKTYDVISNNCNHFTDDMAFFLIGERIPTDVLLQSKKLLSGGLAWMLRPFLNRWLGGFKEEDEEGETAKEEGQGDQVLFDVVKTDKLEVGSMITWKASRSDVHSEESEIVGQITQVIKGSPSKGWLTNLFKKKVETDEVTYVDIKYYSAGKFREKLAVPVTEVSLIKVQAIEPKHIELAATEDEPTRTSIQVSDKGRRTVVQGWSRSGSIAHGDAIISTGYDRSNKRGSVPNSAFIKLIGSPNNL